LKNYIVVFILLLCDGIAVSLSWGINHLIRFESGLFFNPLPAELFQPMVFLVIFWWIVFALKGMYQTPVALSRFDELTHVFNGVLIGSILIFLAVFDFAKSLQATQLFLLTYAILVFLMVGAERVIIRTIQRRFRWKKIGLWDAVIVGFNDVGRQLHEQLHYFPVWGYRVVGFVDDAGQQQEHLGVGVLGKVEDLPRIIEEKHCQWVLVAPENNIHESLKNVLDRCADRRVRFMIVADYYQMVVGLVRTVEIHGLPMIEVMPSLVSLPVRIIKRLIDLFAGAVMSLILLLVTPLIALAIKINSPGPVFYMQKRVGRGGREFTLLKFRSMIQDAEKHTGVVWAQKNDPRVTAVGRFLRNSHLDELPQFINVLMGQMSLVGPRPERKHFVEEFKHKIPLYERRLRVRPGITGWAQVRHKYDQTFEDVVEKTRYDIFYIDHISLSLDLKILLATLLRMLRGAGH
jgi:exopolysaccharide biosynthesis polyprenyl glycosylphosphotransferase